ncbi:MAG: hypothetical protein J2P19_24690, partial [Pseudonocardia sp.]|nr:hypothetical protein [Pseudonocardia sp.]
AWLIPIVYWPFEPHFAGAACPPGGLGAFSLVVPQAVMASSAQAASTAAQARPDDLVVIRSPLI